MSKAIVFFIAITLSVASQARISFIDISNIADWEKMLTLAQVQNKALIVVLYQDNLNCPECKQLYRETFRNKRLGRYVNSNFIALETNSSSAFAQGLKQLFTEVGDTPEIMVFNNREQLFYRKKGLISAEDLEAQLTIIQQQIESYPTWSKQVQDGNINVLDWVKYQLVEYNNGRLTPSSTEVRSLAIRLDSADFTHPDVLRYIYKLGVDVDFPIFQTLAANPQWISDTTAFSWQLYYSRVFNYNIFRAIAKQDSILLEDVLVQLQKMNVNGSIQNFELKGRQLYLAELNKWPEYDTITKIYLYQLPNDSANTWQREAIHLMEFYPQDAPLGLALNYLKEGLKRAETFEIYYTLSLWLYNYGDYLNAYKAAYRSYEVAKTTEQREMGARMVLMLERY